jgi:hypothetical protein
MGARNKAGHDDCTLGEAGVGACWKGLSDHKNATGRSLASVPYPRQKSAKKRALKARLLGTIQKLQGETP